MYKRLYGDKKCRNCGRKLSPLYANQRTHVECRVAWRKKYLKAYHRKYQQKIRQELKRGWDDTPNYETQGPAETLK